MTCGIEPGPVRATISAEILNAQSGASLGSRQGSNTRRRSYWPIRGMLANHTIVIYPCLVRECAKLGCREMATATMALRYGDRICWIADLVPERDPNLIDLCGAHADSMIAPYGWDLIDDRRPIEVPERIPELIPESLSEPTAAAS